MIKATTVLGKAAALAMLPALTLGIFAVPGAASAYGDSGMSTMVMVSNTNMGFSMTDVVSGANSGGNTIVGGSASVGGDSGDNTGVTASARANTDNDADADVEGEGEESGETEVEGEAGAAGDATAYSGAHAATGNGGAAGRSVTVSTILTGNAVSDVAVVGGTDENDVDIDLGNCADCAVANEYYEDSVSFLETAENSEYSSFYSDVEEEGDSCEEDCGDYEYDAEEGGESGSASSESSEGAAWSIYTKTYVPVKTFVGVENNNFSMNAVRVVSGANSGMNTVLAGAMSMGGDSGDNTGVTADASASTDNDADADVEGEGEEGDETEVEGEACADGDAGAEGVASGFTGNGGAADDSTTDSMIVTGRSDSIVTIVEASRHNVVRIQR